ncbi:hypothetical protein [Mesorhizobium sp. SEMIA 3007]|uniref:hypothetical protein n=1 Tax=Mesorhizobium sp. SEMIA 3007 TaxID=1862350 RepID=UPI001FDA0B8F|nr:hypothetical protein [Mesorhizobium sp. SEMIA 3007]
MTRPASPGGAIEAAIGTRIWIAEQAAPRINRTISSEAMVGAKAATPAARAAAASMRRIRARFSARSAIGTRKNRPAA